MGLLSWLRGASVEPESASSEPETKALEATDSSGFVFSSFSAGLVEGIRLYGMGSTSYGAIYRAQPAVYTVVEFLAKQIAGIGLKCYRRVSDTDRKLLRDGPLPELIRAPVEGFTYEDWIHRVIADYLIFGNCYLRKMGDGAGRMLVPLPVAAVTPEGGSFLNAGRYRFQLNQTQEIYPADEIVHFRTYNPDDPRIGVSPLEPLRRVLAGEDAAGKHWESLWRNGARVDGWLTTSPEMGPLTDEQLIRLKDSLANEYSGSANAGKVGILEPGMNFAASSWSPKEAEFISGRKLTLETVAVALNVPLAVLSLTDTATYASQKDFRKQLYSDTLMPIFKMIEGRIERDVVPWVTTDKTIYVQFNVEEKLRGSFEEQADAMRAYVGVPILTVNEARALQDRPRIDDPDFDVPVKPANIIYGGAGAPGQQQLPPAPPRAVPNAAAAPQDGAEIVPLRRMKLKQVLRDSQHRIIGLTEEEDIPDNVTVNNFIEPPFVDARPQIDLTLPEPNVNVEAPFINVEQPSLEFHLPEQKSPDVNVNIPETRVLVNVPEQLAPEIHVDSPVSVNVPEQPVTVNLPETKIDVNVPEQKAPTVHVDAPQVSVNVPEQPVTVNVPQQKPPDVVVRVPRDKPKAKRVVRDKDDKITGIEDVDE